MESVLKKKREGYGGTKLWKVNFTVSGERKSERVVDGESGE